MSAPRILLLHDGRSLIERLRRICLRHQASLHLAQSQSDLLDILSADVYRPDLVIAKDVVPDWFTVAATLIACRAFGLQTPFILMEESPDRWTEVAVETAGGALLIDDRSGRSLVPLIVTDWLEQRRAAAAFPKEARAANAPGTESVSSVACGSY